MKLVHSQKVKITAYKPKKLTLDTVHSFHIYEHITTLVFAIF